MTNDSLNPITLNEKGVTAAVYYWAKSGMRVITEKRIRKFIKEYLTALSAKQCLQTGGSLEDIFETWRQHRIKSGDGYSAFDCFKAGAAIGDASTRKDEECIDASVSVDACTTSPAKYADSRDYVDAFTRKDEQQREIRVVELDHTMNCSARVPGSDHLCTYGLKWRIMLRTEQEMHNAWRKRAEEAELATRKPVVVSLERCAVASSCMSKSLWDASSRDVKTYHLDAAKAVLDAAGVKYVD